MLLLTEEGRVRFCGIGALHFRSEPLAGLVSWIAACRIEDAVAQENGVDMQSTLPVPFRSGSRVFREGKPGLSEQTGGLFPTWPHHRTITPCSVGEAVPPFPVGTDLLGRRTLPPRSANPPSSVGEPSLLGRVRPRICREREILESGMARSPEAALSPVLIPGGSEVE